MKNQKSKIVMKKRMTKFICLLLVLVLAMSVLTACGNKEGGSNGGNTAKVDKPTEDREGNAIELPDEILQKAFANTLEYIKHDVEVE